MLPLENCVGLLSFMTATIFLYSLIYRSRAISAFDETTLTALLHDARQSNQRAQITGLLLLYQDQFLQVLEGAEPELSELYERILADSRHQHVRTLAYGPIEGRLFPDWRMGFAVADERLLADVAGFLPLLMAPGFVTHPPTALGQLLRNFALGRAEAR